ncbi:MAG: hypothetical protein B7Y39_10115 [Bdellovibrio sp. 28-41-41]|nr:MAG: hypothetical protein B7Y39_10115 [Bdellovibrio sp. 28-41-41]
MTQNSDNQPKRRGRPPGSKNKTKVSKKKLKNSRIRTSVSPTVSTLKQLLQLDVDDKTKIQIMRAALASD